MCAPHCSLPRGFDAPSVTATRGTQKSVENGGELLVGVEGMQPTITAKLSRKRTAGETLQLADDKVCFSLKRRLSNVLYPSPHPPAILKNVSGKNGMQTANRIPRTMLRGIRCAKRVAIPIQLISDLEWGSSFTGRRSVAIPSISPTPNSLAAVQERYITKLPKISHVLRNQVILWVFDPELKAKVRGMIVLTSVSGYCPNLNLH